MISLGQAARTLGVSKSTISKAVSRGALSAQRNADGSLSIQIAELMRWHGSVSHRLPRIPSPEQPETPPADGGNGGNGSDTTITPDPELATKLAALEAEVVGLKALIAEVRQSRDDWHEQAARLALPAPTSRPWWKRFAG